MSRLEPKAVEWLRQQIDELGALRNASVRDPQFKAWRQNTLTFIQRIWPGDSTRSERFRRVPFTPPSTKHDARTAREYYERGCGEALEYLNVLLAAARNREAAEVAPAERHPDSFEGDFPEVDLGAPAKPVGAAPPASLDELRFGGPPAAGEVPGRDRSEGPPELPEAAGRPAELGSSGDILSSGAFLDPEAAAPGNLPRSAPPPPPRSAPPETSRISVRGAPNTPPAGERRNPLKDFFQRATNPGPPKKNGKKKKPRLKDLLGLGSLDQETPKREEPAPSAAPLGIPSAPNDGIEPTPTTPVGDEPTFSSGLETSGGWSLPEFMTPPEAPLPLTADDLEPEETAAAPPAAREPAAAMPPAAPEPPADAVTDDDSAQDARVTAEFLENSPVLSSLPRPVQRRGTPASAASEAPLPARGSAASRLLAIAAEVDALGVPEGHRARARAALMDLARQLDDDDLSWDMLREAVHFVMEYPPLARRALPLLLPYLDVAA